MSMSDLAEAKMLIELGVTDPTIYTPEERLRVATHEAGHATVAYFLGQSRQMDVLSIVKRRDSLGLLQHSDTEERFTQRRDELNALLKISMGGLVAEERWFDEVSTGPAGDLAAATTIGAQMIGSCGMGESLISIAAAGTGILSGGLVEKVLADKEARAELDALLASSRDAARAIVAEHGTSSRHCATPSWNVTSWWVPRSSTSSPAAWRRHPTSRGPSHMAPTAGAALMSSPGSSAPRLRLTEGGRRPARPGTCLAYGAQGCRWAVSLNPRRTQLSGVRTKRAMAVLSDIKKAKGRDPVACASTSPMAAPWEKATTRAVDMGGRDPLHRAPDAVTEHLG